MYMDSTAAIYLYIVCVQHPAYPLQYLQTLLTAEDRADQLKSMASLQTSVRGQFPVAVGLGITASNFHRDASLPKRIRQGLSWAVVGFDLNPEATVESIVGFWS